MAFGVREEHRRLTELNLMTVATQLTVYNGACPAIGERQLQPASAGASYSSENRGRDKKRIANTGNINNKKK